MGLRLVERAADGERAAVEDVRVDLRGADVFVSEQVLDGADIVSVFEQVGGEGVAEGVAGDAFWDVGQASSVAYGALQAGRVGVVAANDSGPGITRKAARGEDILPGPFGVGRRQFALESVGEVDPGKTRLAVGLVEAIDAQEVLAQGRDEALGEHGDAIAQALGIAYDELLEMEVDVLDAQAEAFHEAQAAAVKEFGHQLMRAGEAAKELSDFVARQDGGQVVFAAGAHGLEGELDVATKDVAVEKEEGGEGLVLGRGRDVEVDGEVSEEGFDFRAGHEAGMALVVEEDEAACPMEIGRFCAE